MDTSKRSIVNGPVFTVRGRTRPSASQSDGPMRTVVAGTSTTLRGGASQPSVVGSSGAGHDAGGPVAQSSEAGRDGVARVGQQRVPRRKNPAPHGTSSLDGAPAPRRVAPRTAAKTIRTTAA